MTMRYPSFWRALYIALVATCLVCAACTGSSQPTVITRTTVAQGELQGVEEGGLGKFKAIPYALPPVDSLRWHEPVALDHWEGVYLADHYAPKPPQKVRVFPGLDPPQYSEDCLYINVVTPATRRNQGLPVMVWIHGGGFNIGGYQEMPGDFLARRGVVFVSIAYRTGALGFLALPELSASSPRGISGNYGLMDQIMALRWVNDNIAAFGGDPGRITIFGSSAGAISASMLCASPLAKGLFQQVISQSGGSFCPVGGERHNFSTILDLAGAEAYGLEFMHRVGARSLDELRRMDPMTWVDDERSTGVGGFWPCVDGYVLTGDQYTLYEQGEYSDVNVLLGTTSDEGTMFCQPSSVAAYRAEVQEEFGPWAPRVLAMYPASTEEETFCARSDIFRETAFAWPTFAWATLQQSTGRGRVYMYYFDQPSGAVEVPGPQRGAAHSTEMGYVFGTLWWKYNRADQYLSDLMMTYWTNFAKTGDPNVGDSPRSTDSLPYWPPFDLNQPSVMLLKDSTALISLPHREELALMDEFFRWKRNGRQ